MIFRLTSHRAVLPVALAILLVGTGACSYLRAVTGVGFQRPSLSYESWSPQQVDLEGVTIALQYRLDNPNDFAVDLRALDYRLEVEGQQVAEGKLPVGIELPARGATPVSLPVRLRWRDIPNFLELLVTRTEVAYRVAGNAGIGSALGTVTLPFEHQDRLVLPRPSIRLGAGASG